VKKAVKTVVAARGIGIPEIKAAFALLKLAGGVKEATLPWRRLRKSKP